MNQEILQCEKRKKSKISHEIFFLLLFFVSLFITSYALYSFHQIITTSIANPIYATTLSVVGLCLYILYLYCMWKNTVVTLLTSAGAVFFLSILENLFEQMTSHTGYAMAWTLGSVLLSILLLYFLHKKTERQKPKEEQEHFVVYLVFGLISLFFIVFCFFVSFSLFSHFFPYIDKPISLGINALGMVLIIIFLYFLHRKINPKKPKDEQFPFIYYVFFGFAVLFLIALFVGSASSIAYLNLYA